jgi:ABC-2 type transport system ATP-binding protein
MIAVKAEGLVKRFGPFTAVDGVSFEVDEGAIFGFLGPNGAGKTTTIRMLCGLLAPTEGAASVAGFDVAREPDHIKANIGYMSQKFSLYADLTVKQNLAFYAGVYGIPRKRRAARIDLALRIAGLQGLEHRLTETLAGGVKQRLALGAAILHEPRIVFLDEPTAGVDPASRRDFWDLISELRRQGVTVFVTTHYMDEAEHCDCLILIYSGRKIAEASPRDLVNDVIRDNLLEVTGPPPQQVVERLASDSRVRRAQIFGLSARVLMQDGREASACLKELLTDAGWPEARVRPIRASLEDAFMQLIELEDERIGAEGGRTR